MEEGSNPFYADALRNSFKTKGYGLLQRVRILKFLMHSKEHPTVEMIFNALLPEMPSFQEQRYIIRLSFLKKLV